MQCSLDTNLIHISSLFQLLLPNGSAATCGTHSGTSLSSRTQSIKISARAPNYGTIDQLDSVTLTEPSHVDAIDSICAAQTSVTAVRTVQSHLSAQPGGHRSSRKLELQSDGPLEMLHQMEHRSLRAGEQVLHNWLDRMCRLIESSLISSFAY